MKIHWERICSPLTLMKNVYRRKGKKSPIAFSLSEQKLD